MTCSRRLGRCPAPSGPTSRSPNCCVSDSRTVTSIARATRSFAGCAGRCDVESLTPYRQVWVTDFEFTALPGERPAPLCCVAREVRTGELKRLWLAGDAPVFPPYPTGPDALLVAYYASAEWTCHLALGWRLPARILDLYPEFRNLTS